MCPRRCLGHAPFAHWSSLVGPQSMRARSQRSLTHQLDLAEPPCLVEKRLEWAVKPQDREPSLARHGLDPIAPLYVRRLGRAEIDCRRSVGVRFCGRRRIALTAGARIAL